MQPLVSVITSSYNCGRYLGACIESVRAQTFGDWEHLILEAGSNDDSKEILRQHRHDRLVVCESQRIPVSAARNELIRRSRGEYIAILDADDVCVPERLDRQLICLKADGGLEAVGSRVCLRYTDGTIKLGGRIPGRASEIAALYSAGINIIPHSTLLVRRRILDKTGLYDERMCRAEDFDLIYRITRIGAAACIDDCLIEYCMRNWEAAPERRASELKLNRLYVNSSIVQSMPGKMGEIDWNAIGDKAIQVNVSRKARRILIAHCLHSVFSPDPHIGLRCRAHLLLRFVRTTLQIA